MIEGRCRNLAARSATAIALMGAALLLSSCTTADWGRFFYDNAQNVCDSSAYHCDGGYRTGDEWRHPGGTAPKPNLPKNTPPY
jgi:hypothetical protein